MIKAKIVTPEGVYKEFETPIINVTSTDGDRGILSNHMPIVLMLKISRLETKENGEKKEYAIGGGMLYFKDNIATILVDSIEAKEDIDISRADAARKRAEDRVSGKVRDENFDLKRAQTALAKAMNRINVSNY